MSKRLTIFDEIIDGRFIRLQPLNETFMSFGIMSKFLGILKSRAHFSNDNWKMLMHSVSSVGISIMKFRSNFRSSKFFKYFMSERKYNDQHFNYYSCSILPVGINSMKFPDISK